MQALAGSGDSPAVQSLITKVQTFPLSFTEVGEEAKALPRLFHRDLPLQKALMAYKMAEASLKVTASSEMTKLMKSSAKAIQSRMRQLAETEVQENFKMVQKLNLIEVETIQRIHADQKMAQDSFNKGEFAEVSTDQMVFPDDGHPWIDELDKYEVRVNRCPENIRRKM